MHQFGVGSGPGPAAAAAASSPTGNGLGEQPLSGGHLGPYPVGPLEELLSKDFFERLSIDSDGSLLWVPDPDVALPSIEFDDW